MEEKEITISPIDAGDSLAVSRKIIEILDSKKAKNIKLLHVEEQTVLTDYFVLCTGNSNTQIKGYAGEVEFKMGECGVKPLSIDGYEGGTWVALDYGCVIVHIFNREQRNFYNLEKLWGESSQIDISDLISED